MPVHSHNANLAASITFKYLNKLKKEGKLGSTLFIQADNCAKESHNQYFFALMCFLIHQGIQFLFIHTGWFKEILLSNLHLVTLILTLMQLYLLPYVDFPDFVSAAFKRHKTYKVFMECFQACYDWIHF